jgi:hypothetical protein
MVILFIENPFKFTNPFYSLQTNLNFERFLLAKLNLKARINTKELCNGMNAINMVIYLNIPRLLFL